MTRDILLPVRIMAACHQYRAGVKTLRQLQSSLDAHARALDSTWGLLHPSIENAISEIELDLSLNDRPEQCVRAEAAITELEICLWRLVEP